MSVAATENAEEVNGAASANRAGWPVWTRIAFLATLVAVVSLAAAEFSRVTLGRNTHVVIPGKVYRSAQPTQGMLKDLISKFGIRTVVNLRGTGPLMPWYQEEAQATCAFDVNQEDINLSAGRLPSVSELRQLIEVLDQAEYPILLHCQRGADRTGLAAALVLLLQDNAGSNEARRQLSWRFGHVELGLPARMASFYHMYDLWLAERGLEHAPATFRQWVLHDYRGGPCQCTFEKCQLPTEPIRAGQACSINVRVRNSGSQPWHLNPMPGAGVHLMYLLQRPNGAVVTNDRVGLFDATVEPGQCIDLTLPIVAIAEPGEYRLVIDMIDEQMGIFFQMGSEPLELRLDVRE